MKKVDFLSIEKKWQKKWEQKKAFQVKEEKKKKYYVLEMYPYPSASYLHMGHVRNYTIGDVYARFKRMNGFNVLYPMGYDSFGLPAETAAKKQGIHPKKYAESSIKKIMQYQKSLGNSYDWNRIIASHDSDYYKWNQFFFLKMFEKGLAYRKKAPVNWCEKCESVLANEEAEGGKCWRCGGEVVKKDLEQWFFKITKYADKLLKNIKKLKWPEKIKIMQRNWIGKSCGTEINFKVESGIKNCIIIHGSPSKDRTKEKDYVPNNLKHWIPWLKRKLEDKGVKTAAPQMPTPWAPKYDEWKDIMNKLIVNENTILIGHSAGGAFLVRWLRENKKKIKKLILVSPGKAGHEGRKVLSNFYGDRTDKSIKNNIGEIIIFTADDDIDYHIPVAHEYQKELGGKLIHLGKGYGHFCEEGMGTKEFPKLLDEINDKVWPIFTTRPDTIYGVTFMVISAQHPAVLDITTKKQKKVIEAFVKKCKRARTQEEVESLEKQGVFTGAYAVNPLNNEKIPIWAGNFVVADYGSGMVMAVPGHDQRDFEFAKKYKLPIKEVIKGGDIKEKAYTDEGKLVNSGKFNNINSLDAIEKISDYVKKKKVGKKTINYKIRDWLISRQRYWGTPIPIIYCDKCGSVGVPEKQLPVKLPEKVNFKSKTNPLLKNQKFINVKCPKCKGKARRETDTMGGFMDSSWYFLRYCDAQNKKKPFDNKKVNYWMPVDQYIGGAEHAVMHLIYARFFVKVLKDLGFIKFDEPFMKLFNQGIVYKDGAKMSKSKGNVVFQTDISKKYGIDTARLFLMFVATPDKQMEWSNEGVEGSFRIINKLIILKKRIVKKNNKKADNKINITIKKVTQAIESFEYPKAVISIIEALDYFDEISKENYKILLKLISVFCPHICEELWSKVDGKGFVSLADWPKVGKINKKFEKIDEANEKLRSDVGNIIRLLSGKGKKVKKVYVYCLPNELDNYNKKELTGKLGVDVELYKVNNKKKYDPQGFSKKAKPGKPALYVE